MSNQNKKLYCKKCQLLVENKNTEFCNSTDLIKKEYDDDVHELQNKIREEI